VATGRLYSSVLVVAPGSTNIMPQPAVQERPKKPAPDLRMASEHIKVCLVHDDFHSKFDKQKFARQFDVYPIAANIATPTTIAETWWEFKLAPYPNPLKVWCNFEMLISLIQGLRVLGNIFVYNNLS